MGGTVDAVVGRPVLRPDLMKPVPYPLLAVAGTLGIEPAALVLIGDSTTDVEAARAAGVRSIGFARQASEAGHPCRCRRGRRRGRHGFRCGRARFGGRRAAAGIAPTCTKADRAVRGWAVPGPSEVVQGQPPTANDDQDRAGP
ncbi:HAD hydrolase-like protein [Streptomyces sp. R33]